MTLDPKGLVNRLESEIDATNLLRVIDALAEVCRIKAEHLRTTWNSPAEATIWERAAGRLDRAGDDQSLLEYFRR